MFKELRFVIEIMLRALVCVILLMWTNYVLGDINDSDNTLHFHWAAASGNVAHYNVYLYIDGVKHSETWTADKAPSPETPYAVPIIAEAGRMYQLQVQAEDASGATGPMSKLSDPIWCQFPRSPGDINGSTPGDADGNLRVIVQGTGRYYPRPMEHIAETLPLTTERTSTMTTLLTRPISA